MKIFPIQSVYDTFQLETTKSKSEILDILQSRMKYTAKFTDNDTIIRMSKGESYSMGTGKVGFSVTPTPAGNSIIKFDFYSKYPSTIVTMAIFVTALFSVGFIVVLFLVGLANFYDVVFFYLKFMLTVPFLAILIFIQEKVSRYATEKFVKYIVRDL